MRKVCEANQAGSFDKAARLLQTLADLPISAKRAQLITERVGAVLREQRDQATATFLRGNYKESPPASAPSLMVVTADRGRVQTRQADREKKRKEDKVAVVYDAIPTPERGGEKYHGPGPITRSVVATMSSWDDLGDHAGALAEQRGYAYARQKIFISDGASGIRSIRERCFPDAAFILDWAHAAEHLHGAGVAAHGTGAKTDAWVERQKERLWNGHIRPFIAELARQSRRLGPPPKTAPLNDPRRIMANNVKYFRANRDGINYPRFRKNGWPIGSGIIESTVKQISKRVKGTEKHWSETGVEETLEVVTRLISEDGRWENFWRRCPLTTAA